MIIQKNFLKLVISILGIYFIICFVISCLKQNVMDEIGEWKIDGAIYVPEIETDPHPWEWMGGLETMGALWLDYKEEYLREDVSEISLRFSYDKNDVGIYTEVILSESDKVTMGLGVDYDYEKKELIYEPVYIVRGDLGNIEEYTDEKSIDECLSRYGLTRKDVQEYQEYAIYEVVVKTWTKAHKESYWVERWKLKCKVVDNTFRFDIFDED